MSDAHVKDQAPTPEELEREARRLARVRHLTLVQESVLPEPVQLAAYQPDPDPQAAA